MDVNSNWDFIELVDNLKMLKHDYNEWLASFLSCPNNTRVVNLYVKFVRNKFYSLGIKEWQIDKCWEYMNDDIEYKDLCHIINRIEKEKE